MLGYVKWHLQDILIHNSTALQDGVNNKQSKCSSATQQAWLLQRKNVDIVQHLDVLAFSDNRRYLSSDDI